MRQQFILPEFDREFLKTLGLAWETNTEAGSYWLLLHEFPVPQGYNIEKVTVALMISAGYPEANLDMVYFFPHLARLDGKAVNALAFQSIEGKTYQRWSRHRTPQNPWRPGEDDISTHLALVENWLEKELTR
jgi:Prokaryotic E2 family E